MNNHVGYRPLNPNVHIHILSLLNDDDFYNSCMSSERMKNICMNDPNLARRLNRLHKPPKKY